MVKDFIKMRISYTWDNVTRKFYSELPIFISGLLYPNTFASFYVNLFFTEISLSFNKKKLLYIL